MQHAIAARLTLPNPECGALFLQEALDFKIEHREDYGWWAENGAIVLILQPGNKAEAVLELQCTDIQQDANKLLQRSDVQPINTITQQKNRIEYQLISDCGITLILSKILNEDERNELLQLPTTLPWDNNTELQTRRILRTSPLAFRKQARIRISERAEYLAVENGELAVQQAHAMQAFIDVTPDFQHQSLFDAMREEGVDPTPYIST